ncbi:MAG: hypothetical protein LBS59_00530 [Puniceicoccales bacterium]|nr:hypothetical protein [Puniceicoccales bacterium]
MPRPVDGAVIKVNPFTLRQQLGSLKPVRLGGVNVQRATLYNPANITRSDLREGDTVFVERRSDVIPAVTGVDLSLRPATAKVFAFPEKCSTCGMPILLENNGAVARHTNPACPLRIDYRIKRFVSRPHSTRIGNARRMNAPPKK